MKNDASSTLYANRRARLARQLGADGLAVIPTAPERPRNRDSDFLYRHDSYFYYLTGFTEPNACLVLDSEGEATLFCAPKDPERETWDGYRLGPDAAPEVLGVMRAYPIGELDARLPKLLENRATVWYPFATHAGLETRVDGWLSAVRARVRYGALCPEAQRDLCALLDEMRLVKDPHELGIMRRAAAISADAHSRAMRLSARMLRDGADLREYHLDAELLHAFRMAGSQYPAYPSIVAAGLDPDNLPMSDPSSMSFGGGEGSKKKAWKDIWGSGQGIGAVKHVASAQDLIARLKQEYRDARDRLSARAAVV